MLKKLTNVKKTILNNSDPFILVSMVLLLVTVGFAEEISEHILTGTVLNAETNKPVDFATIIVLEAQKKTYTDTQGFFEIVLPSSGTYTVMVRSDGLVTLQEEITIAATRMIVPAFFKYNDPRSHICKTDDFNVGIL